MDSHNIGPGVIGGEPPEGFQLEIRAQGFALSDEIRQYARDHVAAKLAKHARAVQAVIIRFGDINGPKHGEDKRCRVEVIVRRGNPIVVEEIDGDLHAAMDRAADRAEEALSRELGRRRAAPRQRGGKAVRERKTTH